MLHVLKTWPEPFDAIAAGLKRYERRTADRPYAVGDRLRLRRYDPLLVEKVGNPDAGYTGQQLDVLVTYMGVPSKWLQSTDEALMSVEPIDDIRLHVHIVGVAEALRGGCYTSEQMLADAAAERMRERGLREGVDWKREVKLTAGGRIDFVLGGSIGIELKIKGSWSEVLRQVDRYAEADDLTEVWVLSTRSQLVIDLPQQLRAKPIRGRHIATFA
jgi:hypothetical protein